MRTELVGSDAAGCRTEGMSRGNEAAVAADVANARKLYDLNAKLSGETDLYTALDEIIGTANEVLGTARGCVQMVSADGARLEMFVYRGYEAKDRFVQHFLHRASKPACDSAREHRQRLIIEDIETFEPLAGTVDREVALTQGVRATQSTPFVTRHGEMVGVLSNQFAQPHRPSEGELRIVDQLAWTAADFIVRHRVEAALQDLNRVLEAQVEARTAERNVLARIVETTDLMMMSVDLGHTILAVNKAKANEFERIYGVRPKAGDNILDLLADQPEHLAEVRAIWGRGLAGEEGIFVEAFGNPSRARPSYEVKLRTLFNEHGERVGCYQFMTDVTERLSEQAMLVEAQEQLRQSQKLEALGQLTGGVAHDFNNLLTVIKSASDLLMRPNLSEERSTRYISAISETADRAAKLTGQLLAFARRQSLKPTVFDAAQSIRMLGGMMVTLIGSRIKITTQLPDEPCFINADPSQFDTALVNLAVNARDAMNGEGELVISVCPTDGVPAVRTHPALVSPSIAISIMDTGTGIPADQIERIYEPFFTTKGVGLGTGLGLSQVFGFVKQSGGEVIVESIVGKGTTFTLYLPCAGAPDAVADEDDEAVEDGSGTCVLVVEDNQDVGAFVTQTLDELGYRTKWVKNAQAALAELAEFPGEHEIVFSDVVMPGMDGVDLGHEIARLHPGLPFVLTSGYSHVLARDGGHGFELLQKPYSVEALSRVLQKAASKKRGKEPTSHKVFSPGIL